MIELGPTRYGKARIRLVKLVRLPDHHVVRDLTVAVALEGDFAAAHTDGDQSLVVPTDTMKHTVYALAKDGLTGSIEAFGLTLGRHFRGFAQVERATISLEEHAWAPIATDGGPAPDAFFRQGDLTRTAVVSVDRGDASVEAGIEGLTVMKTAKSAFAGFPRDRYTTLKETQDRIMATKVTAAWRYADGGAGVDFDAAFDRVRGTLLTVFAEHFSPAVQTSIWIIGKAVLEAEPAIEEIRFALPNLHHWTYDLSPFGLENDREIFVATEEPHGLIEATVRRSAG